MIEPGLVSITFRKLDVKTIIELVSRAGLRAIEWGGDIHVPHGDVHRAREVGDQTRAAGLKLAAYGSYYRLHHSEADGLLFDDVLNSAVALGAPSIRVWAGKTGSADADDAHWTAVIADLSRIADKAGERGVGIVTEYHAGSLTDTGTSTLRLMEETNHPNVGTLWQPRNGIERDVNLAELESLRPWLTYAHVFHWWPTSSDRYPLAEGEDRWFDYLKVFRTLDKPTYAMIDRKSVV